MTRNRSLSVLMGGLAHRPSIPTRETYRTLSTTRPSRFVRGAFAVLWIAWTVAALVAVDTGWNGFAGYVVGFLGTYSVAWALIGAVEWRRRVIVVRTFDREMARLAVEDRRLEVRVAAIYAEFAQAMQVIGAAAERMTPHQPRDRYALCTTDCTTDCGACKGAGKPSPA